MYIDKDVVSLKRFLQSKGWEQDKIGLSAIPHLRDCYSLFYSGVLKYSGVIRAESANDVALSNIPKGEDSAGMLYFNKDGYSVYCRKFKEYWEWVRKRNEARYNTTMSHGKNYDSKIMMHVFRLLLMAREIATEGKINVYRNDRDFLLSIRNGRYEYDELLSKAEALKNELALLYQQSSLPKLPDKGTINRLLIEMRKECYRET